MPADPQFTMPPAGPERRLARRMQRWLDEYLVWHSPQLAVAAMQAMAEERRNQRRRNGVCESAMPECRGQYLATSCTAAE